MDFQEFKFKKSDDRRKKMVGRLEGLLLDRLKQVEEIVHEEEKKDRASRNGQLLGSLHVRQEDLLMKLWQLYMGDPRK